MNKKQKLKLAKTLLVSLTTTDATNFFVILENERILLIPVGSSFYHIEKVGEIVTALNLSCYSAVENNKVVINIF